MAIVQQTLADHEIGRARVPVSHQLAMARLLRFSIDDMLSSRAPGRSKRDPASPRERQIDTVSRLPRSRQRLVADMIDPVLAEQQSMRGRSRFSSLIAPGLIRGRGVDARDRPAPRRCSKFMR